MAQGEQGAVAVEFTTEILRKKCVMRKRITSIIIGLVLSGAAWAAPKPNIVFIMADDLGPGWVDYDGSDPKINTPCSANIQFS